jgi:hypothetical protein
VGGLAEISIAGVAHLIAAVTTAPAPHTRPPGLLYAIIFFIVGTTLVTALALFLIRRWIFGYPTHRKSKPLVDAWALAGKRLKVDDDPDDQQYPPKE